MAENQEVTKEQVRQAEKFLLILFFSIVMALVGLTTTETWTEFFKSMLGVVVFIDIFLLINWWGSRKN